MKSILISIKPKHCANILNGIKTIEIRKRFPKDYRGWVYIYCTKEEKFRYTRFKGWFSGDRYEKYPCSTNHNGKVVARFYCDNVEEMYYCDEKYLIPSCLNIHEMFDYLKNKNGYAINITKLEIFDTPKELSEFKSYKKNIVNTKINGMVFETELDNSLTKAPQSMMYIETDETR